MNSVGERIYKLRKDMGMTQDELAQKLGYKSKSSINKIEMGKSEFPQKKLNDFAKVLNTTPGFLLGLVSEDTSKINATLAAAVRELTARPVEELNAIKEEYEVRSFAKKFSMLSPGQRTAIHQLMDVFLLRK